MNKTNKDLRISNKRYYLSAFSMDSLLLEKELKAHNIKFTKYYHWQTSVVYSFFEKDIEFVDSVLEKMGEDSIKYYEKKQKTTTRRKKITIESKQKKIAEYLIILIIIIIIISIL